MYGGFCQAAKKSGRNNEEAVRRGFTVLILGNNFIEEVAVSKEMTLPSDQSMLPHIF